MYYSGIGTNKGKVVDKELAVDYVLSECGAKIVDETELTDEFRDALELWYFSGNWEFVIDAEIEGEVTEEAIEACIMEKVDEERYKRFRLVG